MNNPDQLKWLKSVSEAYVHARKKAYPCILTRDLENELKEWRKQQYQKMDREFKGTILAGYTEDSVYGAVPGSVVPWSPTA